MLPSIIWKYLSESGVNLPAQSDVFNKKFQEEWTFIHQDNYFALRKIRLIDSISTDV